MHVLASLAVGFEMRSVCVLRIVISFSLKQSVHDLLKWVCPTSVARVVWTWGQPTRGVTGLVSLSWVFSATCSSCLGSPHGCLEGDFVYICVGPLQVPPVGSCLRYRYHV